MVWPCPTAPVPVEGCPPFLSPLLLLNLYDLASIARRTRKADCANNHGLNLTSYDVVENRVRRADGLLRTRRSQVRVLQGAPASGSIPET